MRIIKKLNDGLTVFQYTLKGNDLASCGTNPITLTGLGYLLNQYIYLPVHAVLISAQNGTGVYDFGANDHLTVCQGGNPALSAFIWYEPLQGYDSQEVAIGTLTQRNHTVLTISKTTTPDINYKPFLNAFVLTTTSGNDATTVGSDFELYITTYKLLLN
jgi:hypothetical protein